MPDPRSDPIGRQGVDLPLRPHSRQDLHHHLGELPWPNGCRGRRSRRARPARRSRTPGRSPSRQVRRCRSPGRSPARQARRCRSSGRSPARQARQANRHHLIPRPALTHLLARHGARGPMGLAVVRRCGVGDLDQAYGTPHGGRHVFPPSGPGYAERPSTPFAPCSPQGPAGLCCTPRHRHFADHRPPNPTDHRPPNRDDHPDPKTPRPNSRPNPDRIAPGHQAFTEWPAEIRPPAKQLLKSPLWGLVPNFAA